MESEKHKRDGKVWVAEDEAAFRAAMAAKYDHEAAPDFAEARLWHDGIIDPADTRRVLGLCLAAASQGYADVSAKRSSYGVFRM